MKTSVAKEPGRRIDDAVVVEGMQDAAQPLLEGMQPHKGRMRAVRRAGSAARDDVRSFDVGQRDIAKHADRQVAKAGVFARPR